jgi:predicted nucleotidyltransferase
MIQLDEIVRRIESIADDKINLIVLFGSRARDEHSDSSDLDIAIGTSLSEEKQRFDLKLQVISILEGPNLDVDVVIIEDSNWSLNFRIASEGKVLFERDENDFTNFIEKVMIFYPDYRIFEQKMLRESLESN